MKNVKVGNHTWLRDWTPPSVAIRRKYAEQRRLADVDYQNMLTEMQIVNDGCTCQPLGDACEYCCLMNRQRYGGEIPFEFGSGSIDYVPAPESEPLTREERFELDELRREMRDESC